MVSTIVVGLPKWRDELGIEEQNDNRIIGMWISYCLKCWNNITQRNKVCIHEPIICVYISAVKVYFIFDLINVYLLKEDGDEILISSQ